MLAALRGEYGPLSADREVFEPSLLFQLHREGTKVHGWVMSIQSFRECFALFCCLAISPLGCTHHNHHIFIHQYTSSFLQVLHSFLSVFEDTSAAPAGAAGGRGPQGRASTASVRRSCAATRRKQRRRGGVMPIKDDRDMIDMK